MRKYGICLKTWGIEFKLYNYLWELTSFFFNSTGYAQKKVVQKNPKEEDIARDTWVSKAANLWPFVL